MKRTCKVCKLEQAIERFPKNGPYWLHVCKPCHEEHRKPRVRHPLTPEQVTRRAERRRKKYRELRRRGLSPQKAASQR